MSTITLTLGGVVFTGMEIPAAISWGGAQAHQTHKMLGGARVIDALGRDDRPITWAGRFQGANALTRAQTIDQMRASGQQVALTWDNFSYLVLVAEFSPDYQRTYQIPYSISLEVVSSSPAVASSKATLDDLVDGDVTNATTIAAGLSPITLPVGSAGLTSAIASTLAGLPGNISNPIAALQSAVSAVGTLQGASLQSLGPVATAAQQAFSAIGAVQTAMDAVTLTGSSVAGVVAGQFAPTSIATFIGQTSLITQQASVQQILSLVSRVKKNLAQATG